jgi:hypothetical protein
LFSLPTFFTIKQLMLANKLLVKLKNVGKILKLTLDLVPKTIFQYLDGYEATKGIKQIAKQQNYNTIIIAISVSVFE